MRRPEATPSAHPASVPRRTLVATSAGGSAAGADAIFRTAVHPPVSFALGVTATPRLAFLRPVRGVRRGRSCRAVRRAPRRGRCTALEPAGTLTLRSLAAGTHRVRFAGRLDRRRTLRPGRYRLRVSARAGRARAIARALAFTVLPRRVSPRR